MRLLSYIRERLCKHRACWLRFIPRGTFTDGYIYQCVKCGKYLIYDKPLTCEGCVHGYSDQGGVGCDLKVSMVKVCLIADRKFFDDRKEVHG